MGAILGCSTTLIFEEVDILVQSLIEAQGDYKTAFAHYQVSHQPRVNQLQKFEREFANVFITKPFADPLPWVIQFYDNLLHFLSK